MARHVFSLRVGIGQGDIAHHREVPLSHLVAMLLHHLAVELPLVGEFLVGAVRVEHDRVAFRAGLSDGVRGTGGQVDRWVRVLERPRQDEDVVEVIELAVMAEAFVPPGLLDYVRGLSEPFVDIICCHAEKLELCRVEAAARAPVEAPIREDVEHAQLFGEAQRMVVGVERDRGADAKTLRSRGDVCGHEGDGRANAVRREVVLREPDAIELAVFHHGDAVHPPLVNR